MTPAGLALGIAVGLSLGLLGGGGSILTVPVFVYVLGFGPKESIAMSLAAVGAVSVAGALAHWRVGNVKWRIAGIFSVVAMAGTYLGARLAVFFSGTAQLLLFSVVMLVAAFFMLKPMRASAVTSKSADHLPILWIVLEGLAVGVLTGLVGVGGGFLIVPALVLLGRVPMKQAVGTSLVIIAFKSAAGFVGYMGQVTIDWSFIGPFIAVAMLGILIGSRLVHYVPQRALQRAFAVFLLVIGTAILYSNRGVFTNQADSADAVEATTPTPSTAVLSPNR
jgi:uncharacterized membrane protein YfcA